MRPAGTFAVHTLGCKANQYDGQVLREALVEMGFVPARQGASPSVCVVNACAVTARAEQKCRQLVRRLARRHPGARIVVTGCYAARAPDEIRRMSEIAAVVQPGDIRALGRLLGCDSPLRGASAGSAPLWGIADFHGHSRAFLKIQDGCDGICSYCIVPRVRPRLESRPPAEVVEEARLLADKGFSEIVLTGIRLGKYGHDLGDAVCLADVLEAMEGISAIERVRLSSLEPMEVTSELLSRAAHLPKLCRHLHLPLQSGADAVLARMNRPYDSARFLDLIAEVRERLPGAAVSTDVIVGSPGETAADHERTLEVCAEAGFCRIHVFPFSARPGTPAAQMGDCVEPRIVKARAGQMADLARRMALMFRASLIGKRLRVLFEKKTACPLGWRLEGYSDEYQRVGAMAPVDLISRTAFVMAEGLEGETIVGRLCAERQAAQTCANLV